MCINGDGTATNAPNPVSLLTSQRAAWKRIRMKHFCLSLVAVLLAGCAGPPKKGMSAYDEFDEVKVDQMVGNNISKGVFEKTIICLNARRETRQVTAITNVTILPVTNLFVNAITNQTITVSTNYIVTTMTNLVPPIVSGQPAPAPAAGGEGGEPALSDAATLPPLTNTPVAVSTNLTASLASNQSASTAPNQSTANSQFVRTLNNQITTTSNNLTVALMTNLVVTAETNEVVNYVTNSFVGSITNVTITPTNHLDSEYFLYTEMTPPSDFALQTGESLVLLVDGVRYGLSQSQPSAAFVGRKGFVTGMYRVHPQMLVAIANAQEVRLRFKGVNSAIEREMNQTSRDNFKKFLLRYFTNPAEGDSTSIRASSSAAADKIPAITPVAAVR
jgi:hypothetical protein